MEKTSFQSDGREIALYVHPGATPQAPALLLLHGAGGLEAGRHSVERLADGLSAAGYAIYIVEYFQRTGTVHASLKEMQEYFEQWLETIRHAVDLVEQHDLGRSRKIGLVGYSLGGFLAVSHASRDQRISAVAEFAGGIDTTFAQEVHRLPPLLIVHGDEDVRVPFLKALELANFARSLGTPVETDFYPGEKHVLSEGATLRAIHSAKAFFQKCLRS